MGEPHPVKARPTLQGSALSQVAVSPQRGHPCARDPSGQDWLLWERRSHFQRPTRHGCELQPDCPWVLAKAVECLLEGEEESSGPDVGRREPGGPIWLFINILASVCKQRGS